MARVGGVDLTVRVVDAQGRTKDGWVCCGGPSGFSDRAQVRRAEPGESAFR
jgi:hypothetical protein